jgi:hypothetical protein
VTVQRLDEAPALDLAHAGRLVQAHHHWNAGAVNVGVQKPRARAALCERRGQIDGDRALADAALAAADRDHVLHPRDQRRAAWRRCHGDISQIPATNPLGISYTERMLASMLFYHRPRRLSTVARRISDRTRLRGEEAACYNRRREERECHRN